MRTVAILPVKSFDAAKERLGSVLGGGTRKALAQAMLSDVLSSLSRVEGLDESVVVTRDRVAELLALRRGARVLRDAQEVGQSSAASIGIAAARGDGFERALLLPGDTPLLEPAELSDLLAESRPEALGAVIVPDRHGTGTNALLLMPPDAIDPSFGPGSLERHVGAARAAGVAHVVQPVDSLALDVDTADDLDVLTAKLAERRGAAPNTSGALRQLDRAGTLGPAIRRRAPLRAPAAI